MKDRSVMVIVALTKMLEEREEEADNFDGMLNNMRARAETAEARSDALCDEVTALRQENDDLRNQIKNGDYDVLRGKARLLDLFLKNPSRMNSALHYLQRVA